jgi:glycosyltransferase involved in cell wall biosynthesis
MVTYNHEKFIAEALDSVMMQITNFDCEIVIGEDCSSDGTRAIVKDYERKYPEKIRAIYQEKNVGALRNAYEFTLPKCKGTYIAPLEGDDYWIDPYRLQKQVDFLESNQDYGLIYGNQYHLGRNGEMKQYIPASISSFEDLLFNSSIPTASTCFRRCLISQFVSDTSSESTNWLLRDFPLWLYIYQKSKIYHLNEIFSVYRRHDGSATDFDNYIKGEMFYLSVIKIKKYFYSFYDGERPLSDFINKEYHSLFLLSIEFRKILMCFKYFPYASKKNYNFIKRIIVQKGLGIRHQS